jgi:hypothetical protein
VAIYLPLQTVQGTLHVDVQKVREELFHTLQVGLIFGKTDLLRKAFEEANPKSTASLHGAFKLKLNETPTHIQFTGDEGLLIATLPSEGGLVLECDKLREEVRIFVDEADYRNPLKTQPNSRFPHPLEAFSTSSQTLLLTIVTFSRIFHARM